MRPSALADNDTQHACGAVLAGLCQSRTELRGLSWDLSLLTLWFLNGAALFWPTQQHPRSTACWPQLEAKVSLIRPCTTVSVACHTCLVCSTCGSSDHKEVEWPVRLFNRLQPACIALNKHQVQRPARIAGDLRACGFTGTLQSGTFHLACP